MSATPKQQALIEDLFNRKGIPTPIREQTRALYTRADQRPAHEIRQLIDGMFALPDAARPERPATPAGPIDGLIRRLEVPCAMYAIPTTDLPPTAQHLAHGNSLLFVQVREYRDTRYVRVLRGAPGSFIREKPSYQESTEIVSQIASAPREYTQLFGDHYSCCSVCLAELTDDESRRHRMGPTCRRRFGL